MKKLGRHRRQRHQAKPPRPVAVRPPFVLRGLLATLLLVLGCASPAPPPAPRTDVPESRPVITQQPATEAEIGSVRVVASMLNLRRDATTDAEVVSRVRRGERLAVLEDRGEWLRVRTGGGEVGWVSARYVARDGATSARSRRGCPPDSDFTFVTAPRPSFSQDGPHGIVTVEANVDTRGIVTATKIVSNTTGDDTAARTAEAEIRAAKFAPPVKNCVARPFVFTYRRAF